VYCSEPQHSITIVSIGSHWWRSPHRLLQLRYTVYRTSLSIILIKDWQSLLYIVLRNFLANFLPVTSLSLRNSLIVFLSSYDILIITLTSHCVIFRLSRCYLLTNYFFSPFLLISDTVMNTYLCHAITSNIHFYWPTSVDALVWTVNYSLKWMVITTISLTRRAKRKVRRHNGTKKVNIVRKLRCVYSLTDWNRHADDQEWPLVLTIICNVYNINETTHGALWRIDFLRLRNILTYLLTY